MIKVTVEGIANFQKYLEQLPKAAAEAASLAINATARGPAIRLSKQEMEKQVAFPTGYLSGDRFGVTSFATPTRLEAEITARQRPTSLARFALPGQTPESTSARGAGGVAVMVKPGHAVKIRSAFMVRLNRGAARTKDNYNLGIAVRSEKAAEVLHKKEFAIVPLKRGLYVLYGPSVDQVFQQVAGDISQELADYLASEFVRQFARITE